MRESLILSLNVQTVEERLENLKKLLKFERENNIFPKVDKYDANNHIHTIYSFSPYSPTMAAYKAYSVGLETMGIMDHDSLSGAKEFISACEILGTNCTVGFETRVHYVPKYNFGRINNPDQHNHIYIAVHGIPHQNIDALNAYLQPIREERNIRNRKMVDRINQKFKAYDIELDFDKDIYSISMASEGGSITERHLLYALSKKIFDKFNDSKKVADFLKNSLNLNISAKVESYLLDEKNNIKIYDLLGVLKSDTSFFYIPATDESPEIEEFIKTVKCLGAVVAYPYLGDVGDSVTGDKKAQKFEDDFLDELMSINKALGIDAVAYMPTRNTEKQLARLRELCQKYDFFEISGEDINSPRQSFQCPMLKNPNFSNLISSTWALIGHEKRATKNLYDGMFTEQTKKAMPQLDGRIAYYEKIGKAKD